ncbi:MAG TPA: NAD-dependent protein deacetylase [Candidatus Pelethocola excrementipullorum]|nr:NAD-dependent protein deacetylase [Candidatus Pelethocola excrementipullorum]
MKIQSTAASAAIHQKNLEILLEQIEKAEAICVGGASGMSAAAGYIWYKDDEMFQRYFGNFANKYGINSIFNGFYYRFQTREERWAYIATLMHYVQDCPVGQPYQDLHRLLAHKNYSIVTTNQDTQFSQEFGDEKTAIIQGDWRYFQCSTPCHDGVYPGMEVAEELYQATKNCRVPGELIPKCPKCGRDMEPWVRGYTFLEGIKYREQYDKWNRFLEENRHKKILFLELGIGRMTPMFIQEPFWNLTYNLPQASYITINPTDALLPKQLVNKGWAIQEDIARIFQDAVHQKESGDVIVNMKKEKESHG